jgi:hypothetical protein
LRDKSHRKYSVAQEDELADSKKPDLRINCSSFDAPVPIELKLAENCSGNELFERLENQLCGDYLRDERSNRGVFLLVNKGNKKWDLPNGKKKVHFNELVEALQSHWFEISENYPKIEQIEVIGIDLAKRKG